MNREQSERHEQGETDYVSFRDFRAFRDSDLQRTLPFVNPEDSRRHLLRGKGFSRKGVTPLRTPGTPPLSGSRLAWRIRSLPG